LRVESGGPLPSPVT